MSPTLVLGIAALVLSVALMLLLKSWIDQRRDLHRFQPVKDAEAEADRILAEARNEVATLAAQRDAVARDIRDAEGLEAASRARLAELQRTLGPLEESADMETYGIYTPMFDYEDPDAYRETIKTVRTAQKAMVKAKAAVWSHQAWTVNNSAKQGEKFIKNIVRLVLQAFNGECDSLIGKVNASNWDRSIARIEKAQTQINKIITVYHLELMDEYVQLRVKELRAKFELERRRAELREQEKAARAEMREEKKRQQEIEREKKRLAQEAERERRAVEQARRELEASHGEARSELEAKIAEMERKLADAQDRARSISMAELTRVGHVYVVSNVGSFGENVFKVGMTRRLDPSDRVKELSDASVPFAFDLHAMIKADDAPELEAALHKALDGCRLNRVNMRKEFFRVDFDELVALVEQHHGTFEFVRHAVAEEYRQTLSVIRAEADAVAQQYGERPAATH